MTKNFSLKNLPQRTKKPREWGYTMVIDKGLSLRETEDLLEVACEYIDIVKIGWTTSYVYTQLKEKIQLCNQANIPVCFGGTLFEAFVIRNQFEEFRKTLAKYRMQVAEISDGSIELLHDIKCHYIHLLSKELVVLSEVGSKDIEKIIPPYQWIELMQKELDAGAWKIIGEARENGNVGLFRASGEVRSGLVQEIITKIPSEKIIWEAPQKSQQIWFIKLLGANVNLGNIPPNEVISLETLRLGLRSDTFYSFLDKN